MYRTLSRGRQCRGHRKRAVVASTLYEFRQANGESAACASSGLSVQLHASTTMAKEVPNPKILTKPLRYALRPSIFRPTGSVGRATLRRVFSYMT